MIFKNYTKELALFGKLSLWIAAPVIAGVLIGKWLDAKYGSDPWLFLFSVGVAFFVSMIGLIKEASKEFKKIEKDHKNDIHK